MTRYVPCAARASDACVEVIPLGDAPYRDPDAAAICGPCADALDFQDPMTKKLTSDNGEIRDATPEDLEETDVQDDDHDDPDGDGDDQDDEDEEDGRAVDVSISWREAYRRVGSPPSTGTASDVDVDIDETDVQGDAAK